MAGSKPDSPSKSSSDKDERHPHDHHHHHHHHGETHGLRDDIDEKTPVTDVKAPNVFERAKEEIEAIVEAIHPKKEKTQGSPSHSENSGFFKAESKSGNSDAHSEKDGKAPNFIEKAKEEIEALMHKDKSPHHHHKETHGKSDDIDETTPIDEVKAPNVFERAKEEFEALIEAVHPKKGSGGDSVSSPKKHGGFRMSVGKGLEKICSPKSHNRDD